MSRIAATDRMARLVAAIPWIVAQDGAPIDEIVERFDYPRDLLLDDLQNVVFFVGVPPYTPDTLIEVQIDDDLVWIDYADWFARPMRLTGGEALALLTAGESVLAFDNQDEAGPLARGLAKLRLATGTEAGALGMQLGEAPEEVLDSLRAALDAGRCVDIDYYSFARNERSHRRIEPTRFFTDEGNWYVAGFCHRAGADRVFRVDRIEAISSTDEPISHPPAADGGHPFSIAEGARATVRVPADRMFLLDHVPTDSVDEYSDGLFEVVLPVSSPRWLERLMVRVGAGGGLVAVEEPLHAVDVGAAASRMLDRYGLRS